MAQPTLTAEEASSMASKYKYRLEHRGVTIAESDWSNILFDYTRRRPEKAVNYVVYNNITELPAGTSTKTVTVKAAATGRKPARKGKTVVQSRGGTSVITK